MTESTAICRFCHASCGIRVTIEENRVHIIGDLDNPGYHGYGCVKGRSFLEFHSDPGRVPHPLQRDADGELRRTISASALDGIAHRLRSILAKHGPRSACWRMGRGSCRPPSTRPCDRISRYRAVLARTREDR